jgi:hypothetical protein
VFGFFRSLQHTRSFIYVVRPNVNIALFSTFIYNISFYKEVSSAYVLFHVFISWNIRKLVELTAVPTKIFVRRVIG